MLRDLTLFAGATLAFVAGACSSSNDAAQTIPTAGAGGTGASGGSAGAGGTSASGGSAGAASGGNASGGAGTGSGGSAGGACIPAPTPASDSMAGESGSGGEGGATSPVADTKLPWLHTEGALLKDPSGNTVVLRGVDMIDLPATQQWEGGIYKMIDRLTNPCDAQSNSPGWSTKVLRLAITPGDSTAGSPAKYLPDTMYYEKYLRPTVDYAAQKGLYVIIDWHYVDPTSMHVETTSAFWHDIAGRFADDSNVFFELYNEPTDDGNWATTKPNMETWLEIVRDAAPNNVVLVGTPNWCQRAGDAARDPIDADNLMYVAHMYPTHWAMPGLRDQISMAAASVPVFISEWGFEQTARDSILQGTITSYGDPFKAFVEDLHLSWSAWCASASWAPPMFNTDYTLKVGEGEMGGFVKDWLYEKRDADLPTK